ncbi:protein-export membrane protein SecF [Candidatus Wolfebacteria bacterium CG1_02_39_135]|uniref:Protein-export membrane protein SecF n=3 Tax=Candidatus Wolfeibacteriota TaxID=1752735 RepID=A0A2M7Q6F6_9BACT|nr:protein translocase subunit SecF [Parcubacteria group bacterium]NCP58536.1 protein translocase subunit SecF [Candidatus Wolfebacteria bacterium]OIO64960.1 MAG: protein-export membrane protein SecF [Candidatus Wolfebacteria bacterium CG1_02_39_135]PIU98926.1 MAG: protein translocase subunit SecF [Candidatus Wolfebacteria bacterium CG03_land_8_20_14_0_80_39_317]PIY58998.1 MAG: protein translocase subunit SecF [Candidatus Wolfebacteria bacterium CG_4_10_14_0_8_um_filter_39_64]
MNIIGHRKIFLSFSGILVSASIALILIFGFRPGIDFVGGTLWQIKIATSDLPDRQAGKGQATNDDLKSFFENNLGVKDATIFPAENQSFLVRFGHISEEQHQNYFSALRLKFGDTDELRFENIGPAVGKELRTKAFWAIALVLLGISIYIAFAFRKVSYPIKSWKYGVITLITLFHDIAIPAGFLSVLGWKWGIEIDTNFIVALLVIMGFSVHDTIVVFDRIRENLLLNRTRLDLPVIINSSVNQTIARSINTSLTLVLVLLALFFLGPVTLKYFVLTILIGTIVGTYSSIFVASPLLLYLGRSK